MRKGCPAGRTEGASENRLLLTSPKKLLSQSPRLLCHSAARCLHLSLAEREATPPGQVMRARARSPCIFSLHLFCWHKVGRFAPKVRRLGDIWPGRAGLGWARKASLEEAVERERERKWVAGALSWVPPGWQILFHCAHLFGHWPGQGGKAWVCARVCLVRAGLFGERYLWGVFRQRARLGFLELGWACATCQSHELTRLSWENPA